MARDLSLILLNAQSQGDQKHVANRLHYALVLLELNARNAAEHQLSQWESQSLPQFMVALADELSDEDRDEHS
jgi:hypothetical protein